MFICRLSLFIIYHIYVFVINSNITINTLVPRIHKVFRNIPFGFGFNIPGCIVHHFKHGKNFIIIKIRTDKIQFLFCQWKWFVIIWIKYPTYRNNKFIIQITNRFHQLYQGYMFSDIVNNIKITLYLSLLFYYNKDDACLSSLLGQV